jgi:hypothetical protein
LLPVLSGKDFLFLDPCPKRTWAWCSTFTVSIFSTLNLLVSSTTASSAENLWRLDFEFFGLHQLSELFSSPIVLLTLLVFSALISYLAISSSCSRCLIPSYWCDAWNVIVITTQTIYTH